jgi:hypothetical protein
MLAFSVPPGYRRGRPPARPKLDPYVGIIDRILEEDKERPAKQQHTSKRIFERLRDEHGYSGGITVVKEHFSHPPPRGCHGIALGCTTGGDPTTAGENRRAFNQDDVNDRNALIERLDRVRVISHNFGYGVGDDMDSLPGEYLRG